LAAVAVACLGIAAMTHRANAIVGEAAWPPTPDSNCVKFTNELTIKPIQSGMKTYSDSYDSVGQCFRKCRRRAGYMYIVENTSSGQCYCYNLENEREWGFTSHNGRDTEDDVLYSIENCFRLPTRECPPYDQPGWIDNPGYVCRDYDKKSFKLAANEIYIGRDGLEKLYSGTLVGCKDVCLVFSGCGAIAYDRFKGECNMLPLKQCKKLNEAQDMWSAIYCGQ